MELVDAALDAGLEALAITDHDTFSGFDLAREHAADRGLDLICGIEVSTKFHGRTVHLLGYFPGGEPSAPFRAWVTEMQESRRDRNRRLVTRLNELGIDLTLNEVERKGRNMTGRPHFARVMLDKGYVSSLQQAFDDFLDESAKGYVDRIEPDLRDAINRINQGGGLSSIAHPVRIDHRNQAEMREIIAEMAGWGLGAIEVYHSDHSEADTELYLELADRNGLEVTGGSDFHGDVKPGIRLGVGPGTLKIPRSVLDRLRVSL